MAVRVKIIKEKAGFNVGDVKSLALDNAKNLEALGVCEILGKTPTAVDVLKKSEESAKKIEDSDKRIDEVLAAIKGIVSEKIDPINLLVLELKSKNEGLESDIKALKSQLQKLKTTNK